MKVIVISLLAIIAGCAASSISAKVPYDSVSLVRLLTRGERYNGASVNVVGVVFFDFESGDLFLDKGAYAVHDNASAIIIDLSDQKDNALAEQLRAASGKYISISGQFLSREKLHDNQKLSYQPPETGILHHIISVRVLE